MRTRSPRHRVSQRICRVPMLRDGNPIGAISVAGAEAGDVLRTDRSRMLQTFADQAVIAIENTRLFNELQTRNRDLTESLEQQTATSEILRVISQSQRDVQPVFEAIAANAREAVRGQRRGESTRSTASSSMSAAADGLSSGIEVARTVYPMASDPRQSRPAARSSTGAVAYIPDVRQDPEYRMQEPGSAVGFRSVLAVPCSARASPIGAISVTGAEPAMFTERQIAMLQTFADQAVIAIENTRLFNELQTRNRDLTESLEQQTATSEILRVISQSQRDVQPVFEAIAANARKLCEATSGCGLHVRRRAHPARGCSTASVPKRLEAIRRRSSDAAEPRWRGRPRHLDASRRLHSGYSRGSRISLAEHG